MQSKVFFWGGGGGNQSKRKSGIFLLLEGIFHLRRATAGLCQQPRGQKTMPDARTHAPAYGSPAHALKRGTPSAAGKTGSRGYVTAGWLPMSHGMAGVVLDPTHPLGSLSVTAVLPTSRDFQI